MRSKMFVCAVIFAALASGVGYLNGGKQLVVASSEAAQPKANGDELAMLGKARRDAAEKAYTAWIKHEWGLGAQNGLNYHLSMQWLNSALDLATKKEERTTAFAAHLQRMKAWEEKGKINIRISDEMPDHPYMMVIVSCRKEAEYWVNARSGK